MLLIYALFLGLHCGCHFLVYYIIECQLKGMILVYYELDDPSTYVCYAVLSNIDVCVCVDDDGDGDGDGVTSCLRILRRWMLDVQSLSEMLIERLRH